LDEKKDQLASNVQIMPTFQLPKELNNSNKNDVEFSLDPTQQKM
jgi:hypothetical protein